MTKKRGLNFKFTVLFLMFSFLLAVLLCGVNYQIYKNDLLQQYCEKAMNAASTAAFLLDSQKIEHYSETQVMDEEYEEEIRFIDLLAQSMGVENLYVLVPVSEQYAMFIYDASEPGDGLADSKYERMVLGDLAEYDGENYSSVRRAIENKTETTSLEIVDGEFGYLASAYELIYKENGELLGFVGADFLMSEIKDALRRYLIRNILLVLAVVSICTVFLLYKVKKMVILPVQMISEAADKFARTDYNANLQICAAEIHTQDELEQLNDTFTKMMKDIVGYVSNLAKVTAEKEKISAELNVASSIQESMLPSIFPAFPERKDIDIYATMTPAKEVGGDFYDFFFIDKDHMAVVIADVSGKGVPAALFMVIAKTLLKNEALSGKSVGEIFTSVNQQLVENNKEGMFVTSFMGILELSTGRFTYASAGHNPPLHKEKEGQFSWVKDRPSMILAGLEGVSYTEHEMKLKPGDVFFMYTDGVTEALNPEEDFYGEERLINKLNEIDAKGCDLETMLEEVRLDLQRFRDTAMQADDITILIFQYYGNDKQIEELKG
ncbi:MAG: SpoIIE family protein phosphatase [Lachnospiraceae bacterium]|nr:SpoIIE family protein phosphatase [Lachnospiraceae bacterium]